MIGDIRQKLSDFADIVKGDMNPDMIEEILTEFVVRIVPTESEVVKWYMNLGGEASDTMQFVEEDYILWDEFGIRYDEAKAYRKSHGSYLRLNQWQDIKIQIFIRE
jgi:hypothetical protein